MAGLGPAIHDFNPVKTMSALEFFQALELQLLTQQTRRDSSALKKLLADDFLEFGASGQIYTRQDIIAALPAEPVYDYRVTDFAVRDLNGETKLITYRSTRTQPDTHATRTSLRSSIWQRIDGDWKMIFHQGTVQKQNA